MPEIVDAHRRQDRDDGRGGSIYSASLGGSAGDPAAPYEPDGDGCDCAACKAPRGRFYFRRNVHFVRLPIQEKREFLFLLNRLGKSTSTELTQLQRKSSNNY